MLNVIPFHNYLFIIKIPHKKDKKQTTAIIIPKILTLLSISPIYLKTEIGVVK